MAISLVTVGGKITAAIQNAIIGLVNAQGMTGVVPTSVAGTGVTVGVSGKVTFSGSATISVNGCFTGTYDNYRIMLVVATSSGAASINFNVRSVGTDLTTGTYLAAVQQFSSATPTYTYSTTATTVSVSRTNGAAQASGTVLEVLSPYLAQYTTINSNGNDGTVSNAAWGAARNTTSYDGFTISTGAVTLNGTLRIYGYNNN